MNASPTATESRERTAGPRPRFAAMHSRNFRLLWAGLIVSNAGSQMQTVAQGYLIYYVLTHSPFWLGMASMAFAIPMTFLPPVGGIIADRFDKLRLLKFTQTGQMLSAAVLSLITLTGNISVWWILTLAFVAASFLAADNPARQALLPDLVPREDLVSAAALNSASYTGAALIGPALGGLLLPVLGPGGLFLLNALSFLAVLIPLFLIRGVDAGPGHHPTPVSRSLHETFGYLREQRSVALLLVLAAVSGFFGRSYIQLTPAFGRDVLHVGEVGLGMLYAMPGLGALVGAGLLAGSRTARVHKRILTGALLAFSALLIVYSLNRSFALALVILVAVGAAPQVAAAMITTSLQLQAPGRLRGRILALNASSTIGLASFGGLAGGLIAEATGPGLAVATGAVVMGIVALLVGPRLGDLDGEERLREAEAPGPFLR